jgi:Pentapeptide repeats (8 copies)
METLGTREVHERFDAFHTWQHEYLLGRAVFDDPRRSLLAGARFDLGDLRDAKDLRGLNLLGSCVSTGRPQMMWAPKRCAGVDFRGATAEGAIDTHEGDFSGALFDGADLRRWRFLAADLRGASFRYADLRGVDFTRSALTDTVFDGAQIEGARFSVPVEALARQHERVAFLEVLLHAIVAFGAAKMGLAYLAVSECGYRAQKPYHAVERLLLAALDRFTPLPARTDGTILSHDEVSVIRSGVAELCGSPRGIILARKRVAEFAATLLPETRGLAIIRAKVATW